MQVTLSHMIKQSWLGLVVIGLSSWARPFIFSDQVYKWVLVSKFNAGGSSVMD